MNKQHYQDSKNYAYVGFRKDHPFDDYSRIRIAYKSNMANVTEDRVKQDLINACEEAIQIYGNILSEFN